MIFLLYLSLHCPLSSLVGLWYILSPSGGSVPSNKLSSQVRGRFRSIIFRVISVPVDIVLRPDSHLTLPSKSVDSILRGLRVFWICREMTALRSIPLHTGVQSIHSAG